MRNIALLGIAALFLEGCVPVVVGGAAATAGYAAAQERGPVTQVQDTGIRAQITDRWQRFNPEMASELSCNVFDGKVLITGTVKDPEWRVDAVRLAWQVDGVREVHSEVEVRDPTTLSDDARDTWITTRLRSALTFDSNIRSLNYTIETVNGVVYLIGSARSQAELDRVTNHARNIPNVRKVVTYVDIRPGQPSGDAPAPAQPAGVVQPPAAPYSPTPQETVPAAPPAGRPAPIEARPLT